ncbi:nuclear transport factor 2 family protein [Paenibacillus hunanensis]|uniref:nuclear transport factor 2 family protein n=1 Tax=Paenibacillus hunanensis TaxID=539262 RepID=UPI00202612AD|nr:nuclear transport factor 2 family protein [Paenibacillus hunanensis]MCL9661244.1 nuclear transport factor 2 family protein [Paenibacillus hunanensis]
MPKKSYALLSMTLASALALSTVGVAGAAASECGTSTTSTASVKAKTAKAATTTASSQQSAEKANQKKLAENKQFVLNMFKDIFTDHKLDTASKYIADDYIQHNPLAGNGREAFVNFFAPFVKQNPQYNVEVKRIIAQGDLVLVHSLAKTNKSDRGMAVVDIFRLERVNGKPIIKEHWDIAQQVPEKSANSNTMFPLPGTPVQVTPASSKQVAANVKLVTTFYNDFFNKKDGDALKKYVDENYIQHNPSVPTGRKPLESFIPMLKSNPDSRNNIVRVIAEGDIVALHVHGQNNKDDRGAAVMDMFRVKTINGKLKIVEHWDVVQEVPEKSANNNTMF